VCFTHVFQCSCKLPCPINRRIWDKRREGAKSYFLDVVVRAARALDGLAPPRKASHCPRHGLRCDFGAVGYLPVFEMAQASWSGQLSSSSVVCVEQNRANARAKAASRSVFVGGSAIGLIVSCKTARARSSHSSSPARSSAHSHQSARIRSRCSSAMDHCKPRALI